MNIEIGEILKAQGIRGEVKVKPLIRDFSVYKTLKTVLVASIPFKIKAVSIRSGFVYIQFEEVSDRNRAETLAGKKISVDRSSLPSLKEDEYYISDLIGIRIYFGDDLLGEITDVENYGSADIFTVKGEKTVRFPFLKKLKFTLNSAQGYATMDRSAFDEVAVYED